MGNLYLAIHVDDGILISNNEDKTKELLKKLEDSFEFTITKDPTSFLGIEINKEENSIKLKQTKYMKTILERLKCKMQIP